MKGGVHPLYLADDAATCALAECLAVHQPGPAMVYLCGDLGAGKSTLARAWLRALGVTGPIRSPTYTLIEPYPVGGGEVLHLDLYRLDATDEWEALGLDEAEPVLWLVEWPERACGRLPSADLRIRLAVAESGRMAWVETDSVMGRMWWETTRNALVATDFAFIQTGLNG